MDPVPWQCCSICLGPVAPPTLPPAPPSDLPVLAFACDSPLCRAAYCVPCLGEWFRDAITCPAVLPLRCCDRELVTDATLALLEPEERTALLLRCAEWQSPVPLYCPDPKCSAFVPNNTTCCPRCDMRVCRNCQGPAHDDNDDDDDEQLPSASPSTSPRPPRAPCRRANIHRSASVLAMLQEQGCSSCPACQTAVERLPGGCSEVECFLCGHVFCFDCQENPDNCNCIDDGNDKEYSSSDDEAEFEAEMGCEPYADMQHSWQLENTRKTTPKETSRDQCEWPFFFPSLLPLHDDGKDRE